VRPTIIVITVAFIITTTVVDLVRSRTFLQSSWRSLPE
jgi:hypothetical protein